MSLLRDSRTRMQVLFTFGLLALNVTPARAAFQGLLVGEQGNGEVSNISGSGAQLTPFIANAGVTGPANGGTPTVSNPHGVAVAPTGNVFVADFGSFPQAIKEFTPGGAPVSAVSLAPFSTAGPGFQPEALVFSPTNGLLYVDSGTGATNSTIRLHPEHGHPRHHAGDPDGPPRGNAGRLRRDRHGLRHRRQPHCGRVQE